MIRNRTRKTACTGKAVHLALLIAMGLLVMAPRFAAAEMAFSIGPKEGQKAPDFSLSALNGNMVSLKTLAGKPLFLNFWATWCPPCRAEMPDMEALHQALGDRIEIIGINQGEPPADVRGFVEEHGYTWTFLADQATEIGAVYGVRGYPTSLFINADGVITGRRVGTLSREEMAQQIRTAIGNDDGTFKRTVARLARVAQTSDPRIGESEIGASLAVLTYKMESGLTHQVFIRQAPGDSTAESLFEFQVPSFDVDEVPVWQVGEVLLNWNLGYPVGAWAADPHNERLTFVAKYRGRLLDADVFQKVCSQMVETVDDFERVVRQ